MAAPVPRPRIKSLVLDAGPLLSLTPLRGLAERYFTVPQVIDELKDPRAREHFERLGLTAGVHVEVRQPELLSLAEVTLRAKKTGDYAVLSPADLCVLALTHALSADTVGSQNVAAMDTPSESDSALPPSAEGEVERDLSERLEGLKVEDVSDEDDSSEPEETLQPPSDTLYDDPESSDDGEGEWITSTNVSLYKSRARDLIPSDAPDQTQDEGKQMQAACMTADYAMQNVLLHMGLNLVGVEGKRITTVKSWVLRCHACFKICKDPSKKFCPSCGNPTLLRTSVSTQAPSPDSPNAEPTFKVHLKPNFQYRNRGTIYSIPLPKPGQAKGGGTGGSGLILREDQVEFQRAVKKEQGREAKEERALARAMAAAAKGERVRGEGSWEDPDWIPGMLLGKGREGGRGLPAIGHGRRNPNEVRRKKR